MGKEKRKMVTINFSKKYLLGLLVFFGIVLCVAFVAAQYNPGHTVNQIDFSQTINGIIHIGGSTAPVTSSQGAYIGWNALTGGTGETDFINNQGGGSGGFAFFNTPDSGTPRNLLMYIGGNGNVGIGTDNPVTKLDVEGGWLRVGDPNQNGIQLETHADFHRIAASELRFWDSINGRDMVTFKGGNVGIGVDPSVRLEVAGTVKSTIIDGGYIYTRNLCFGSAGVNTDCKGSWAEVGGATWPVPGTPADFADGVDNVGGSATIACDKITGGSDSDYCTDATGGAGPGGTDFCSDGTCDNNLIIFGAGDITLSPSDLKGTVSSIKALELVAAAGNIELNPSAGSSVVVASGRKISCTNCIDSEAISTDAVGSAEIATGAVGSNEILNGQVGSVDIAFTRTATVRGTTWAEVSCDNGYAVSCNCKCDSITGVLKECGPYTANTCGAKCSAPTAEVTAICVDN